MNTLDIFSRKCTIFLLGLCIIFNSCTSNIEKNKSYLISLANDSVFPIKEDINIIYNLKMPKKKDFSRFPTYSEDSISKVKIIKGQFTNNKANELLVYKSVRGIKEHRTIPILLFEQNKTNYYLQNNLFCDTFELVDCNADKIQELVIRFESIGNGALYWKYYIISLLNNKIDTIFDGGKYFNKLASIQNYKNGDTLAIEKKFSFFKAPKCKSLTLKEEIKLTIGKEYNSKEERNKFVNIEKTNFYNLQSNRYVKL